MLSLLFVFLGLQMGSRESIPCSGRGTCNTRTGDCKCFTGYITGDGNLNGGQRGDCGFAVDPIASCPLVHGVECGGKGICSGKAALQGPSSCAY